MERKAVYGKDRDERKGDSGEIRAKIIKKGVATEKGSLLFVSVVVG